LRIFKQALSDGDLLALSSADMELSQGERLDELLSRQAEGAMSRDEQGELIALMQVYHQLWLRQSYALAEAVRRGLPRPLAS